MAEETTRLGSIQLASVPEETTSSFAGLAEETTRQASIQLASVPEETTSSFAGLEAPYPPPQSYRESIRSVAWPDWRIRSTLSSLSGQSGSNYSSISGASSSYLSNISGYSVGLASAGTADFGADELMKIAHRMVSDGYTQRRVQAFKSNGEQDGSLKTWFAELDIEWVFQLSEKYECWQQPLLSATCLQDFAERWIRALTIIMFSIKELVACFNETLAVGRFGKVSISAMLVFVDAVYHFSKVENLHTLLQMYICVSNASYGILTMHMISSDALTREEIGGLLERKGNKLMLYMYSMMRDVKDTVMKDKGRTWYQREGHWVVDTTDNDDSWAIEIMRGEGEVHKNTRLMVDYIGLMRKAQASAQSHNTAELRDLISGSIDYLKDLLLRKSELCLDPSLRYLFLLNNSYFIAEQVSGSSTSLDVELFSVHHPGLKLTPECEKYMDSYLEFSWGHVMSCISSSNFPGPLGRWINTSSMAKFQSAFHKTYQAQKFWKVPDPWLRSLLQETITKRVISCYRYYLMEHPDLEKQVSGGSSPEVFEEMLGELFEG